MNPLLMLAGRHVTAADNETSYCLTLTEVGKLLVLARIT